MQPKLSQLNLIVSDMDATVAFYRRLGLAFGAGPGELHVAVRLSDELLLEFDAASFVGQWDSGWRGETGSSTVLGFSVENRERVDVLYADLTTAGYRGRQPPFDAFWGARYAIVDDPDGNGIGLMSPIDAHRKFWPPVPPPEA